MPVSYLHFEGWCIIEWEGENSYDCVNRKKVSAVEGDLMFQPGEKIFANYRGKPFKATIAVIAGSVGLSVALITRKLTSKDSKFWKVFNT